MHPLAVGTPRAMLRNTIKPISRIGTQKMRRVRVASYTDVVCNDDVRLAEDGVNVHLSLAVLWSSTMRCGSCLFHLKRKLKHQRKNCQPKWEVSAIFLRM